MLTFSYLLRQIDFFGVPNCMFLGKEFVYRSKFSGVISFLLFCFCVSIFSVELKKILTKRQTIGVSFIQNQDDDPGALIIGSNHIFPAIKLDQNDFTSNPLIKVEYFYHQKFQNQTNLKQNIEVEPCRIDHFVNTSDSENQEINQQLKIQLENQEIHDWICPKLDPWIIKGTEGKNGRNSDIKILEISLCFDKPYYPSNIIQYNPICGSKVDLEKILLEKKYIKIQLLKLNYLMNPQESEEPAKPYIDNSQFFQFNPQNQFAETDIFYKKFTLHNFLSQINVNNYKTVEYITGDASDMKNQNYVYCIFLRFQNFKVTKDLSHGLPIQTIQVKSNPYSTIEQLQRAQRKFVKIIDLLSFIGGICQSLLFTVGFIMRFYNEYSLSKNLVNAVYNFTEEVQNMIFILFSRNILINSKKLKGQQFKEMIQSRKFNFYFQKVLISLLYNMQLFYLNQPISLEFNFNILSGIASIVFHIQELNQEVFSKKIQKNIVLQIGLSMIYRDFDILRVIRVIQDVEKLKYLLLTPEQLDLFDHLPKPIITVKKQSSRKRKNKLSYTINPQIYKIFYDKLKKEVISLELKGQMKIDNQRHQLIDFSKHFQTFVNKQQNLIIILNSEVNHTGFKKNISRKFYDFIDKRTQSFFKEIFSTEFNQKENENQIVQDLDVRPIMQNIHEKIASLLSPSGVVFQNQYFKISYQKELQNDSQFLLLIQIESFEKILTLNALKQSQLILSLSLDHDEQQERYLDQIAFGNQFTICVKCTLLSAQYLLDNLKNENLIQEFFSVIQYYNQFVEFEVGVNQNSYKLRFDFYNIEEQIFKLDNTDDEESNIYQQICEKSFHQLVIPYFSFQSQELYKIIISKNRLKHINIIVKYGSSQNAAIDEEKNLKLLIEIFLKILS